MEEKRESFVFYASFYEALQGCPDDIRLAVYEEIMRYAIYPDYEPQLTGIGKSLFTLVRPQIDANIRRRENGKEGAKYGQMGGRPKKEKPQENPKETPQKPRKNPTKTPNVNVNVNVNDNVNDNENVNVNENVNENNTLTCVNTHALRISEQSKNFDAWLTDKCPYIAKHYTLPTDTELQKLVDQFGANMVADVCEQIENRADLRKKYTNLYRTLLNWLKRESEKNMSNDERERNKRLASYAAVAAEFRASAESVRNGIAVPDVIPF